MFCLCTYVMCHLQSELTELVQTYKQEVTEAACELICDWAQKILKRSFDTVVEIARFLVQEHIVNPRCSQAELVTSAALAGVCKWIVGWHAKICSALLWCHRCTFIVIVKGAVGDCLQNCFCYAGWKSLHIPIAIIQLSGLNVFIYSVEGVGPRNVNPIRMFVPSILIDFPTCLSTCVGIPLRTLFAQTGYVISTFTYVMQTERECQANINNLTFLLVTNSTIKFSQRLMTYDVL